MIGKTLGHYRIVDRLGAGGMGVVWLAEDISLGRKVAIKTLREELIASPEKRLRFEREARAVAALNHPNIVTLHSVEEEDGVRFLTMEYVEGRTLLQRIVPGGLPPSDLLRIGAEIADALAAAHAAGIVHRDLKPGNILLARDGRVKVVDFGLARASQGESGPLGFHSRQTSLTQDGIAIGTLNYMSPEQLTNREVDHRADLFALGVVLFEMATGEMPFAGDSAAQLITSVMRDQARRIDEGQTKLPPQIVDLVDALLAKSPEGRPASAAIVRDRLRAAIKLLDSDTTGISSAVARNTSATRPLAATVSVPPPSRERSWLALAAVGALVVAGVALVWRPWSDTVRSGAAAPAATAKAPALAVLPLRNFSGDPDYFVDGMTDALIGSLAQVRGLRVISRQSVMRFRASDRSLPEIAQELGAEMLVEGSVSRVGDRIRLQVKLLRAVPEETIWSESLERSAAEVLGLNGAAAAAIARAANVETPQVASAPRVDPELYDELLRAQYLANQLTPESLERSLALYREIVTRDPSNAAAWAGMAIDYGLLGFFTLPPPEASRLAEESARKALALDDERAEAHAALGFVLHFYEWRWNEAESEYRRALDLNPNDASSHHRLWALLAMLGRWDEAEGELETANQLDPLSISIATNVGQNAGLRGDSERAIRQLEHALHLEPDYAVAQSHLWWIQHDLGREKESGELLVRWLAGFGLERASAGARAELESGGYRSALRRAAQVAAEEASRKGTMAYTIAQMFAASGQNDEAIAWLRRGFTDRGPELPWIAVDRAFMPLHERAEYKELLGAMHLSVSDGRRKPDQR